MKNTRTLLAFSIAASVMAMDASGATVIRPTSVTVSGASTFFAVENVINGNGLSAPLNTGDDLPTGVTHTWGVAVDTDNWVSTDPGGFPADWFAASGTIPAFVFDLGGDQQLDAAHFWNYGSGSGVAGTAQGNAAKGVEIRYNTAAQGAAVFSGSAVTGTLAHGPLSGDPTGSVLPQLNVPLGGMVTARYVEVRLTDNWYVAPGDGTTTDEHGHLIRGGDRVGLGEVRFSASPSQVPAYAQAVLAQNPIAYWRLNDGVTASTPGPTPVATNIGSLGAAANGSYQGGATDGAEAPRPPQFPGFESDNTAVQLDGVDDYVGTIAGLMNGRPSFTISGWIRRGANQADRTGLWGQNDLVEFGYINNNTLEVWTDNGLDISPNPIPNGEWAHLAIVQAGSPGTMTMYTNGVPAGSRASTLPADNTFGFNIGGGGVFDAMANFFVGQIDEVAIFDKALSADDICSQYFSTVPNVAPSITRQPTGTNVFEGDTIYLSIAACGSGPLHYQWSFDFNQIPGATGPALVISNATVANSGEYWVDINNSVGFLMSEIVRVEVLPSPPIIITQPQSTSRYVGAKVVFSVDATGGSRLRYQWQRGGLNIPDATNSTYMINNVQSADAGTYRVVLSNPGGTTTSDNATLATLTPAPGYATEIVNSRPLAYWRLGETNGTTAYDYWGGYDGTYTDVTLGVPGALINDPNTAGEFNGTSAYVGTPLSLNGVNAFTLIGWMRRSADQANRTGLWGQNDLVEFGYINNDTLEVWTDNGLDISPNPIPNGEWAQFAIVNDGSPGTITMYTNAESTGSRLSTLPGANAFKFNIGGGGIFDGTGNFFLGTIDDLAVFDRALTQAEICHLFTTGSGRNARPCCNGNPSFALAGSSTTSDENAGPVSVPNWATDISAGPGETNQTVTFHVSNNNPSLFSAQPAINPSGTLTYTATPNSSGSALVTVYLTDNGPGGGCDDNTSETNTFTITIRPGSGNTPPVVYGKDVYTDQGVPVSFTIDATDPDGDPLTYMLLSQPPPGAGVLTLNSNLVTYTPTPGYVGMFMFDYKVCDPFACTFANNICVFVRPGTGNQPPTARIVATPTSDFTPFLTNDVLISCNGSNASIRLNGFLSSDPETPNSELTFRWFLEPMSLPFAEGVVVSNRLDLGTQTVRLDVTDPQGATGSETLTLDVITVKEAIEVSIDRVNAYDGLTSAEKRKYILILKVAGISADRDHQEGEPHGQLTILLLELFQYKVYQDLYPIDPVEAECWILWTEDIIEAERLCAIECDPDGVQ